MQQEDTINNDHDLLIELRTEMRGLREDLKRLSDGVSIRVTNLENNKLDKSDAKDEFTRLAVLAESKAREIFTTKTDDDKDFEFRLRKAETNITRILTWGSALLCLVAIVEFLVGKFL